MTNIIGDIAGQYKALLRLVDKMPKGDVISVGDMVDRGPDSKRVLDYFMNQEDKGRYAIFGNHEHLMVDELKATKYYDQGLWGVNGGHKTLESFPNFDVPQEYIDWLESLPLYIECGMNKDVFISHSFLHPGLTLEQAIDLGKDVDSINAMISIIWNRSEPVRRQNYSLQIAGHNSQFGARMWKDDLGVYAVCLDGSRKKQLCGLHLESMTIYYEDF